MLGTPAFAVSAGRNQQWQSSAVSSADTGAGIGYLGWDGTGGVGADSETCEWVIRLSGLDNQPASITRLSQDVSARISIGFTATWRLNVLFRTSTPTTLVDWTSANNAQGIYHSAGTFDFRIRADLRAGVATFEVYKREIASGIAGDWVLITGAFTTGPTAGTMDLARGGQAGDDQAVFATVTGTERMVAELHYLWRSHNALLPMNAFGVNGVWIDPELVTPFDLLLKGPVAAIHLDQSAAAKTYTKYGSLADV
jgi:hypothetical protein